MVKKWGVNLGLTYGIMLKNVKNQGKSETLQQVLQKIIIGEMA